jgi:hypothetical protein
MSRLLDRLPRLRFMAVILGAAGPLPKTGTALRAQLEFDSILLRFEALDFRAAYFAP